ncbi:MAG: FAD-linked oxidase C-terminal domain-containing protein [Acidimicrobiales bacterium]
MPSIVQIERQLRSLLGEQRVSVSASERSQHGQGESYHKAAPPDIVCWPTATREVVEIVALCRRTGACLIPFGAGTSLEGHVAALEGGVCIDMSRMKRILRVSLEDMDVHLEAGVTRLQLERRLRTEGVFFPVDPGADATIGGMIATGASGTTTVRYGAMRDNVLSLTVVTATGDVVRTRSRARKSSAGYDLTRLFIGSEGTLGIITDAVLRLHPVPQAMSAAICAYQALEDAVACAVQTIQSGVPVARIELLDSLSIEAINRRHGLEFSVRPTLFFEFHGTASAVIEQATIVQEIAGACHATGFEWTSEEDGRRRLWEVRHRALEAILALRPGARGLMTDVCVPISALAACIEETEDDLKASGLVAPLVGHVGDGNFHLCLLIDPENAVELAEAQSFGERLARRAIAFDGTCTGEHGVGYGKAGFLIVEYGDSGVDLMRAVKNAFDPTGIFNPGKVLPRV